MPAAFLPLLASLAWRWQAWNRDNGEDASVANSVAANDGRFWSEAEHADLADVAVAVANPHVLQPLAVQPDGGGGAGELETSPRLTDRD